ncbi:hypothetical protein [Lentimicrobium sp.]|uniref:hypothetical protein n=1 Tax=Lentimicrobium sp. TaxID=2034841 RepID=UPI002C37178F|nr:hypothetical protein [Lentimicrobium sp.]HPF64535.1 hypothetical protein [Lentimicrobium sp.]
MKTPIRTLLLLLIFSIAMGFLESAVVVYLRELYYPLGFSFPLVSMEPQILITELLRETATLIMLLSVAILAGRNTAERFAYFLFCFAIWDIFYYVFLWMLIGWPASLLEWDILFLIPVPWAGPVLAPCLLSLTMICYTGSILALQQQHCPVTLKFRDWILMTSGSLIIILSFTMPYLRLMAEMPGQTSSEELLQKISAYIPGNYNWFLFVAGEFILLTTILFIIRRCRKNRKSPVPGPFADSMA